MRKDLSKAAADLYRLPRDEFTAARNELAKRLRGDGRRDEAEKVRSLRKPTAAAWIVNRVGQEARGDLKKLLAAGQRMREAHTPAKLRAASAGEREAITRLLGRVEEVAGSQSPATIERVRETLHASAGDPDVGALVSAGCLDREQRLVGFGGAALTPDDRVEKRETPPARGSNAAGDGARGRPARARTGREVPRARSGRRSTRPDGARASREATPRGEGARAGALGVTTLEVETPHGPAGAHLHPADEPRAALVLGHGAGGGVDGAVIWWRRPRPRCRSEVSVALVEQPYRVAGRRSPPPAPRLDAAWTAVVDHLRARRAAGLPLIAGGRSAGARVACRTAEATGAVAVLCLAFPLQPPRRRRRGPVAEPSVRARRGQGADAGRAGRAGPVRDSARRPASQRGRGAGRPRPEDGLDAVAAAVRDWLPGIVRQAMTR